MVHGKKSLRQGKDFYTVSCNLYICAAPRSLFGWLVAHGWCWFVLREEYCWLVAAGCWWLVRSERKVLLAGD
jgi:hypothetical protein